MMEYRRKCNVCGKIYCYTDEDLKNNSSNSAMAALSAVGAITSIWGGTKLDTYALDSRSDRYGDKVVDYYKCPECNSSNTSLITDKEMSELQEKKTSSVHEVHTRKIEINSNASVDSLLKRTKMFLEDGEWELASVYCEQILDIEPECAMAYLYKLMVELKVKEQDDLSFLSAPFSDKPLFQKAIKFADASLKEVLEGYNDRIIEKSNEKAYYEAFSSFNAAKSDEDFEDIIPKFKRLGAYKDSEHMIRKCEEKAVLFKYNEGIRLKNIAKTEKDFLEAKAKFDSIITYSDANTLAAECMDKAEEARKETVYNEAIYYAASNEISQIEDSITKFEKIAGWRDADQKKIEAINRIEQLMEIKKKASNKKKWKLVIAGVAVIACVIACVIGANIMESINQQQRYDYAMECMKIGKYYEAYAIFDALGTYRDSDTKQKEQAYYIGRDFFDQKKYLDAIEWFSGAEGIDIDKYIAYCKVFGDVYNIPDGMYLSDLVTEIESLGDFNNANSLIEEIPNINVIRARMNSWWCDENGKKTCFTITSEYNVLLYYKNIESKIKWDSKEQLWIADNISSQWINNLHNYNLNSCGEYKDGSKPIFE